MTSTYSSPEQTTPLLSFVMPAYKGQWLSSAVESILAQTYTNIELIVVNDCSPDDLDATMAQYDDPRIRYYHTKENLGGKYLTKQWEHCIQFARGEYLVIAADDVSMLRPSPRSVCAWPLSTHRLTSSAPAQDRSMKRGMSSL